MQVTADAVQDKTYVGTVTRVSMKGASNGGTTTYPVTIRIDETDGLRPGMNANAEIFQGGYHHGGTRGLCLRGRQDRCQR